MAAPKRTGSHPENLDGTLSHQLAPPGSISTTVMVWPAIVKKSSSFTAALMIRSRCVFPHCTQPAARCDCDHSIPYAAGGTTCSCNTAPVCRRHHLARRPFLVCRCFGHRPSFGSIYILG